MIESLREIEDGYNELFSFVTLCRKSLVNKEGSYQFLYLVHGNTIPSLLGGRV